MQGVAWNIRYFNKDQQTEVELVKQNNQVIGWAEVRVRVRVRVRVLVSSPQEVHENEWREKVMLNSQLKFFFMVDEKLEQSSCGSGQESILTL